ncbi:MAG TPA: CsbD family protein [Caulobacteraceae bacterium]|jgi:uncharacterized protein YjbJ (UPF0337 family)
MDENTLEGGLRRGVGHVEHTIGDAYGDLGMSLHGRVQELTGRMQSAYGQAKDTAAETIGGVDAFVTERPYLTAAIATGLGLMLGFALGLGRPKVIIVRPSAMPRA